jgi:hypothetical protein
MQRLYYEFWVDSWAMVASGIFQKFTNFYWMRSQPIRATG